MDTSRVSLGEMIAAAGGAVFLVCMFLPWFHSERAGRGGTTVDLGTTTGWESFGGVFDLLIVVLAGLPIAVAVWKASDALSPLPVEQDVLVLIAGLILVVLVVAKLIDPPSSIDVEIPGLDEDATPQLALFAGLILSLIHI